MIEEAICVAWESLRTETCGVALQEVDLTYRLEVELGRMMNCEPPPIAGFTAETFETPVRGNELENFDGRRLEKRPDIVLRRAGVLRGVLDRAQCGLFIECKVVDKDHPMHRYAGEGLLRFVDGTYAWAVNFAMMLGYARKGYTLPSKLSKHLEEFGARYEIIPGSLQRRKRRDGGPAVWETRHRRTFTYRPEFSGSPGEMIVAHLWLGLP